MGRVLLLLSPFLFTFLTACGGGGGDGSTPIPQVVPEDLSGYAQASCLYKFSDGPRALPLQTDELAKTYFDKSINWSWLKPVLAASGSELVRFAETTGVRYFRTSAFSSTGCDFLAALPPPPYDLESQFAAVNGSMGSVLGLYLNRETPDVPSTSDNAVIIVRRDANKWVLVHEFMHHIFHHQHRLENPTETNLNYEYPELVREYNKARRALSQSSEWTRADSAKNTAEKLQKLSSATITLMRLYFLEEMTIETILGEKLQSNELTLVLPAQRINGAAYIIGSAKKADNFMSTVEMEILSLRMSYGSDLENEQRRLLAQDFESINDLRNEMRTLKRKAQSYLESQNIRVDSDELQFLHAALNNSHPTGGCSHRHISDKLLQYSYQIGR